VEDHKARILITAPWFTSFYLNKLKEHFIVDVNRMERWYTEDELSAMIYNYDGIIAGLDPFTKNVLSKAKNLKIIARRGIGVDNIDLEYCSSNNIVVTNTPIYIEHRAVAEFTLGLILDATRNITRSCISLKSGSWKRAEFLGKSLEGLTVGILGFGNIGKTLAELLNKLGTRIQYYDPYVKDSDFIRVNLEELFSNSDVISILAPLTSETRKLVNDKLLSKMKYGSIIINVSRGEIIDYGAIMKYVKSGHISCVATDVYDIEPPINRDFILNDRVICTPHIAAFAEDAFNEIDRICTENLIDLLINGNPPSYIVT